MNAAGRIVVVGAAEQTDGAYAASTGAALGLVRAASSSLAARKITVNAVVSRSADTESGAGEGETDAVAELVAFLCTRAADGITGQAITIA
jgi:NAD(P)-dependent dehydrogenase (short-subunit alcohol dehydrogenase family)